MKRVITLLFVFTAPAMAQGITTGNAVVGAPTVPILYSNGTPMYPVSPTVGVPSPSLVSNVMPSAPNHGTPFWSSSLNKPLIGIAGTVVVAIVIDKIVQHHRQHKKEPGFHVEPMGRTGKP